MAQLLFIHFGHTRVCCQGEDGDVKTEFLLKRMNQDGRMHCVPCRLKGKYLIRIVVNHPETNEEDVKRDCKIISELATIIDKELAGGKKPKMRYSGEINHHASIPNHIFVNGVKLLHGD